MREIKYKAYHKKKGLLVDVLSIDFENNMVTLKTETDSDEEYYWWSSTCHLDEVVLMQYTGLKDRNGREIYEGDIVQSNNSVWGSSSIRGNDIQHISRVIFKDGEYLCEWETYVNNLCNELDNIEVIGNIYENKDLLKEKN